VEKSTERKPPFESQESPEIVVSQAVVPGSEGIGSDKIAARGDQSSQKDEHGAEVASGPETMTDRGCRLSGDLEIGEGRTGAAVPTYEQIAHRAYELYLERGKKPGSQHEDWLAAERELSEKCRDNRSG